MTKQPKYNHTAVEQKWRPIWAAQNLYQTGDDPNKPDIYILDFFPYPSGAGLSVGHARNYVPTCIATRYKRMQGFNVLHPMGWDAFGLPAENYAIQHQIHPRESTKLFADTYRRQMQAMECAYDWSREINSTYPNYYKWTQWFFLLLHRRGLAYRALGSQWWCPTCQTILANEQVEQGRCWRCDSEVTKKELAQWYFKITAYADRLLADLDTLNWPEKIKAMQRNWIGRSEGTEVVFEIENQQISQIAKIKTKSGKSAQSVDEKFEIRTFTTRVDTLFGVTFIAIAPEHPLVGQIVGEGQKTAVSHYIEQAKRKSEIERSSTEKVQTGVFTGTYAMHPLTGEPMPIWVADYVLPGYGSGAVMGVPAHDSRDFAFAQTYDLPIVPVIESVDEAVVEDCFAGYGRLIKSAQFTGQTSQEAMAAITAVLQTQGQGQPQVTYKLRDWLISRQRYWGAPIPIVHCPDCGPVPVPEDQLPILLPETDNFAPAGDGHSPLAHIHDWVNTSCPQCGGPAQRETDTMDGFACSSWYFLRFANPQYEDGPFDPAAVQRWLPVDTYVGGAEHAVLHLLYARFWTKVMADAGLIDFVEPFTELRNQGVLSSPEDGRRMSKSRGNVITPDEVIAKHGTDALRLNVVFLGPFDADVTWDEGGIRGMTRFVERFWNLAQKKVNAEAQRCGDVTAEAEFERMQHKIIKRMTQEMEDFRFNTAVAGLMEYLNSLYDFRNEAISQAAWRDAIGTMARLLAPIAPFIAEEVWCTVLGNSESVHRQDWPSYDEALTQNDEVTIVVQVNGKVRDRITVAADASVEFVQETAVTQPNVQTHINGQPIRRIIVVPQKLVNIVV
ncbi:MAG: leucine--tRNA ligase [Ardenticatenaceae bacterium]|nr:leucine--tRNA ligase [Anaerolineales bacterium]MCB8938947.1 leucine--tRNA ligase [Ardenticatenaceae bacterium]MCB8974703.1 leucine--tRNA ligase [Ardenticatenaceae bacterium]